MSRKRDPSLPTPFEIRYAVRRAAELLPEAEKNSLLELLQNQDKVPPVKLLAFFQETPQGREWLQRALYLSGAEQARGYETLPGQPGEIPARSLWKCPRCGFTWRVLRTGRPVPPCPRDGSPLEPVVPKEQNHVG